MDNKVLKKIFLSASIPCKDRDRKYYDTVDVIAIRDAVRALATVVIPKAQLIWGGHPAITPLIRFVMNKMNSNLKEHIVLYQSDFFKKNFPKENSDFESIILVEKNKDRELSLLDMRNQMIVDNDFSVGIFIGGMEGVEDEYELFRRSNPKALLLPIASTGAAAKIIYDKLKSNLDDRLLNDYAYMALFRDLLEDVLV